MVENQAMITFRSHHFVRHLGICNQICVKLPQLMWAVITRNSVKRQFHYINKWFELQSIIAFRGRHFVRHLGICNRICVKLLQIVFGVIPCNVKKRATSLSHVVFLRFVNTAYALADTHTDGDGIRRNA